MPKGLDLRVIPRTMLRWFFTGHAGMTGGAPTAACGGILGGRLPNGRLDRGRRLDDPPTELCEDCQLALVQAGHLSPRGRVRFADEG